MKTDSEFLLWLRDRMEYVYHEHPLTDWVKRIEELAEHVKKLEKSNNWTAK